MLKLDTTRSLLLAGATTTPPMAAAAALHAAHAPLVAFAPVTAMAAVGLAWWRVETIRSDTKEAAPVGYLLDVRDALTPKTLPARVRKMYLGTYGKR